MTYTYDFSDDKLINFDTISNQNKMFMNHYNASCLFLFTPIEHRTITRRRSLYCEKDPYCNDVNFGIELSYINENLSFDIKDGRLYDIEFVSEFELKYFTIILNPETYYYDVSLSYLDCEVYLIQI